MSSFSLHSIPEEARSAGECFSEVKRVQVLTIGDEGKRIKLHFKINLKM